MTNLTACAQEGYHYDIKISSINVKTYGGKQVTIVNGRIVAFGHDTQKLLEQVKEKFPGIHWQDILLVSVPKGLNVIYTL